VQERKKKDLKPQGFIDMRVIKMDAERIKTGIYGLDELMEGGFPKGRNILISGASGTGKSIFATQFIYRGAMEYKEPGVMVTFDEVLGKVRQDMLNFGWNLKEAEKQRKLVLIDASSARAASPSEEEHALLPGELDFDKVLIDTMRTVREIGAKRLVFDSIPALAYQYEKESDIRKAILKLSFIIAKAGLTSVITSEVPEQTFGAGAMQFSKFGVEEYIADGVILLSFLGVGERATRTMYVRKMRGSRHSLEIHPMEIVPGKGIVVKKLEDVFK
jgi:KaiC/GvpD/RAD55 family RecA-like ATPase